MEVGRWTLDVGSWKRVMMNKMIKGASHKTTSISCGKPIGPVSPEGVMLADKNVTMMRSRGAEAMRRIFLNLVFEV